MNNRIREIREMLKLSRSAFGKRIGVSGDVINNLERGRSEVKEPMIKLICSEFSINENWLRYGKGNIKNESPSEIMEQLRDEFNLDDFEYNIVYEYLKLDSDSRKVFRDFFQKISSMDKATEPVYSTPEETVEERINREVAEYRADLELEARKVEGSSALDTAGNEETA